MVSAAEQLASNLNLGAFAKAEDLKRRIWFTARRAHRLSPRHLHSAAGHQPGGIRRRRSSRSPSGILGMFNMFAGGARRAHGDLRAQHHALHLGLDHHAADDARSRRSSRRLKKEGEQGRKQINQYTRYLTVILAALQAYGIAVGLEGSRSAAAVS